MDASADTGTADAGSDAASDATVDAAADAGPSPSDRLDALLTRFRSPTLTDADADAALHEVAWDEGWP